MKKTLITCLIALTLLACHSGQSQPQQAIQQAAIAQQPQAQPQPPQQPTDTADRRVTFNQLLELRKWAGTLPYDQAAPLVNWINQVAAQKIEKK